MKVKTSNLIGPALDWAVAKCEEGEELAEGWHPHTWMRGGGTRELRSVPYAPSSDWEQGGPIIEREKISTCWEGTIWVATLFNRNCGAIWYGHQYGPTPLIAAMRCFIASKLGDEVDVPDELVKE